MLLIQLSGGFAPNLTLFELLELGRHKAAVGIQSFCPLLLKNVLILEEKSSSVKNQINYTITQVCSPDGFKFIHSDECGS